MLLLQTLQLDYNLLWVVLIIAPFLLARAFINERRTKIAEATRMTREQALIADRFTNAVNQLGAYKTVHKRTPQTLYQNSPDGAFITDDLGQLIPQRTPQGKILAKWENWTETEPNLEIRLGGLFALERISQISEQEHIAVMETLCAYIRENAATKVASEPIGNMPAQYSAPRADIQMAIKILGRRGADRITHEAQLDPPYRLDLRDADLAGVDFSEGHFGPAVMARTNLHGAWLDNSTFRGADFSAANMTKTWLESADLSATHLEDATLNCAWMVGANLHEATMNGADLRGAKMRNTNLQGAELDGAIIKDTDIKDANLKLVWLHGVNCAGFENLSQDQLDSAFGDITTSIPKNATRPLWPRHKITYLESFEMWVNAKNQKKAA